jgi:hypothetical protein
MLKFMPFILIAAATPAVAQVPAPQPQKVEPAKKNPLDKVVCRTEQTVGTRLGGHRVCATVREWQEQEQANREALQDLQQRGTGIDPSG